MLTPELAVRARKTAAYLRKWGAVFEGEFARTKAGLIIYDICMRMFEPFELFLAQGFPWWYVIDFMVKNKKGKLKPITKTSQIRMCGNSVPPPFSMALSRANCPEMIVNYGDEKKFA